jgi:hypothetical protein
MDAVVATITVGTTGLHTIDIWMREDGIVLEKLVLTSDASFSPPRAGRPRAAGRRSSVVRR